MNTRHWITVLFTFTFAVMSAQASTSIEIKNNGLRSASKVSINGDGTRMGHFALDIDGFGRAYGFCTDLEHTIGTKKYTFEEVTDFTMLARGLSNCQVKALLGLFAELEESWFIRAFRHDSVQDLIVPISMTEQTVTEAAAIQLMVWEITHDFDGYDIATLDINSGDHVFTGSGVTAAVRDRVDELTNQLFENNHVCVPSPAAAFASIGLLGSMLIRGRRFNDASLK